MQRSLLMLALFLGVTTPCLADDSTEESTASSTPAVSFAGETLSLAYRDANDYSSILEFIPQGQTLETWTRLAGVFVYDEINDPEQMAEGMIEEFKKRSPEVPYELRRDEKTGDLILDFMIWNPDTTGDNQLFVEYDIFKYSKRPGGGLVAQQYALRAYEDIKSFVDKLPEVKQQLLDEMADKGLASLPTETKTTETKTGD